MPTTEESLLRDALGDLPAELISREPLGAGSVAGFTVLDAGSSQTYYVDTSRAAVDAETGMATGDDPARPDARIWLHPADPHLPALAPVAFANAAEVLLARLGIRSAGAGELVAYRPGRRAVLRVPTADGAVWVKVVRPHRVARIVETHVACIQADLPVPAVLGWAPDGLIVLRAAEGTPAMHLDWRPDELLTAVDRLRDRIASIQSTRPVASIVERFSWYAERTAGDPSSESIAERIRRSLGELPDLERGPVHGDLHLGQLFLDDGDVTGLIDVDTVGIGDRAEDPAALVSQAIASAALSSGAPREHLLELAQQAVRRWESDPAVRPYTAIHLLGHAIAAHDLGDHARAQRLLENADDILQRREHDARNA